MNGMDLKWFGMNPNILSFYSNLIPTERCSTILPDSFVFDGTGWSKATVTNDFSRANLKTQKPPRHPTDTPQTSPGNTRFQQTTTDANWHRQTYSNSTCQCLGVSGGVCWRLFACCVPWRCLGGVCGMSWGCLGVSEWYLWKSEVHGCVGGVSGFSVLAVWSKNTSLAQP